MANFSWLEQQANLSALALTIRAQTISPNDEGKLKYDAFAPFQDVSTTSIRELITLDYRPTADRREWNTRGRQIPLKTPDLMAAEITPVESYFKIEEQEQNKIMNAVQGNAKLFQDQIGSTIPGRTDILVRANYRRLDVDWFSAWALNQITVMNPQIGNTTTIALGMAAGRYTTAATAWNDAGINGYTAFLAWLTASEDLVGPIAGAMMRLATYSAILADAPNPFSPTATIPMTRSQLEQRISDERGRSFQFIINEDSHDIFTDGGNTVVRTKVWPAQRVAAVPEGFRVGTTYRAPVTRAWDLASAAPGAGIDVRGMTVFTEIAGAGRDLTVECQGNYLSVPDEQKVAVINAGV